MEVLVAQELTDWEAQAPQVGETVALVSEEDSEEAVRQKR